MEILKELLAPLTSAGRVEWIGIADVKGAEVRSVAEIEVQEGSGIAGEHHFRRKNRSKRQVTLIQYEHLAVVASLMQRQEFVVTPEMLRRNIVIAGINLSALRHLTFRIGNAVLRGTGSCPPCSRMEQNLGNGGYAAMLGHGGITAIVEKSGRIGVGDAVSVLQNT